jgi:hypothetical protein
MMISTDHHRTVRELGSTESRWWCPHVSDQIASELPDAADHVAGDRLSCVLLAPECPHRRRIGDHRRTVLAARSFAEFAAPLASLFIARGMPETFLADLTAATDAYETAVRGRDAAKQDNSAGPGPDCGVNRRGLGGS